MHPLPEKPAWLQRVTIVGIGLLGGSVGMSLRRSGVHVSGYARRDSTCQASLRCGAVDRATTNLEDACLDADVVVVASPVDKIAELVARVGESVDVDCLITDVGSTKAKIVDEVDRLTSSAQFVAAHPIAGSEKTGVENACGSLLDGKVVILTPGDSTQAHRVTRARQFWAQSGAVLIEMSPAEHDERLAEVSHVPHLVSSLLASLLSDESKPLIGSGWSDMTRVASGDPTMWTAICRHNRSAIVTQLDRFAEHLNHLRTRIANANDAELHDWLQEAKQRKDESQGE